MSVAALSETQELTLLNHAAEEHGLEAIACPDCVGLGCARCNGHGSIFRELKSACADPGCALTARMAAIAAQERS